MKVEWDSPGPSIPKPEGENQSETHCPHLQSLRLTQKNIHLGVGLFTLEPFTAGAILFTFHDAHFLKQKNHLSVQVSPTEHLDHPVLAKMNHGCDPNCWIDIENREVVALRDIDAGSLLTFFYPQTEWRMAQPFECHCGANQCLNWISGAADIPRHILARYRLSPHIEKLVEQNP